MVGSCVGVGGGDGPPTCAGVGEEMVGLCRSRGRRWWACVGVGGPSGPPTV